MRIDASLFSSLPQTKDFQEQQMDYSPFRLTGNKGK
jgi:hypothetical protein